MKLRILIACENSGTVRDAFIRNGHDAWSCDLIPAEGPHIQGDAIEAAYGTHWDAMICHPPCTFLTVAAARWFYHPEDAHLPVAERRPHPKYPDRWADQAEAAAFAKKLWDAPIERIALENPVGALSNYLGKPTQTIQPYDFGSDASKRTCLWLKGFRPLVGTSHVQPRVITHPVTGRPAKRWANQSPCGASNLGPTPDRWMKRSKTYPGIAKAMADQWGGFVEHPDVAVGS